MVCEIGLFETKETCEQDEDTSNYQNWYQNQHVTATILTSASGTIYTSITSARSLQRRERRPRFPLHPTKKDRPSETWDICEYHTTL